MTIGSRRKWLALGMLSASVALGCKGMGTDMSSLSRVPPPGTGSYSSPNSYYTPPSGSWSATPPTAGSATNPSGSGAAAGTGVSRSATPASGATSSVNGSSVMGSTSINATIGTGPVSNNATAPKSTNQSAPVVSASTNRVSDNSVQTAIFEGEDSVNSKVIPASGGYSDKPT
ncbi:MAG: hypothetical protein RLY14_666, partial [Planctomycetota bacterium]